jgi:protein-tyrosine phosphatase
MSVVPSRVLCVCLGNICRSPTAEVILRTHAVRHGLRLEVDSAGTNNYHPNAAPDPRSQHHAALKGYDLKPLRARQVTDRDFTDFDLILAMDHANLADLHQWLLRIAGHIPQGTKIARLALMSEHDQAYPSQSVPDPYYGHAADFERVIHQLESSATAWIKHWKN